MHHARRIAIEIAKKAVVDLLAHGAGALAKKAAADYAAGHAQRDSAANDAVSSTSFEDQLDEFAGAFATAAVVVFYLFDIAGYREAATPSDFMRGVGMAQDSAHLDDETCLVLLPLCEGIAESLFNQWKAGELDERFSSSRLE